MVKGRNVGLVFKFDIDMCSFCYGLFNGYMWENGDDFLDVFDYILEVRCLVLDNLGLNMLLVNVFLLLLENVFVFIYFFYWY